MIEKAIEYLKYLHAMEIVAGMNFQAARKDLEDKKLSNIKIWSDLHRAQVQEMKHAGLVRALLVELGHTDLAGLMEMPRWLYETVGAGMPLLWPHHLDAWARIEMNRQVENNFANGGVQFFWKNMNKLAGYLDHGKAILVRHYAYEFFSTVEIEEAWHVYLDDEVIKIYEQAYPDFRMKELLATMNVTRSPFIHLIKARQEFIRSLPGEDAQHQHHHPDQDANNIH